MNSISKTRQSNFGLHFFRTENCLSTKSVFNRPCCSRCLPIAEYLCSLMRWCKKMSGSVPDIICITQISFKFVNHALIVALRCSIAEYQNINRILSSCMTFSFRIRSNECNSNFPIMLISIFCNYDDILILSWYFKVSNLCTPSPTKANTSCHYIDIDVLLLSWYSDIIMRYQNIKPLYT